ncbi:MAG: DUF2306 domain-containing protein [Pseudomonadota bacterium]
MHKPAAKNGLGRLVIRNEAQHRWKNAPMTVAATLLGAMLLYALASLAVSYLDGDISMGGSRDLEGRLPLPVMLHVGAVIPAIPLGIYVFWARKGTSRHKRLGRIWALLMVVIALSSFWIGNPDRGFAGTHFSWIHLLSLFVLFSVTRSIVAIRRGNVQRHRNAMENMFIALLVAGAFTFVPGRVLNILAFG